MLLQELIVKYGKQPFGYNWEAKELDCCHFTANIVKDYLNIDYFVEYRGKYTSEKEAFKLIKKAGFKNHIDMVSKHLGKPRADVTKAKDGDVITYLKDKKEQVIGIYCKGHAYFNGEAGRILKLDAQDCNFYWSIS